MKAFKLILASVALFAGTAGLQVAAAADGGGYGDEAFTAWAFIFNDPTQCVDGCDDGDNSEVVYLTGQRVQSNGRAIFAGSISEDVVVGGLTNAGVAEIHVGLQTHGRLANTAADRDLQTTTPTGACNPDCFIVQFAIFPPGIGTGTTQAGAVVWNGDGSPVNGATATIKRMDGVVVISIDTRL